jgi:hypothetical protein
MKDEWSHDNRVVSTDLWRQTQYRIIIEDPKW